jgi:hypothetical protein
LGLGFSSTNSCPARQHYFLIQLSRVTNAKKIVVAFSDPGKFFEITVACRQVLAHFVPKNQFFDESRFLTVQRCITTFAH